MNLALFDLDHTILDGDTESLWLQFLVKQGRLDHQVLTGVDSFYKDYETGSLDYPAYLSFLHRSLKDYELPVLERWREEFLEEEIRPRLGLAKALEKHRVLDHTLVLITATHDFLAYPIGAMLEMDEVLCTITESSNGFFTGRTLGIPCFREGKVKRLEGWLSEQGMNLENSWFYTDSFNDLPLLKKVTHPVTVHPDFDLKSQAEKLGWRQLSLKEWEEG